MIIKLDILLKDLTIMEIYPCRACSFRIELMILLYLACYGLSARLGLTQDEKFQKLSVFKKQMQYKVAKMSEDLVKKYSNPCSSEVKNCQTKTFNMCDGCDKRQCLNNFPTPPGCLNKGIWLSPTSAARVPNILQTNNLSVDARRFICASALIQSTFDELRVKNTIEYSYAYIGSSSGAIRVAPSFKQKRGEDGKKCIDYDPRIRTWYVSAITGSKNTIILLDISKTMTSMHPGVRFRNAKITLQIIFQSLNRFDYICVVVFSKTAHALKFDKIVNANKENKKAIMDAIDLVEPEDGFTNYTAAIQKAMSMLQNVSTLCTQTLFLLLTDGHTENDQPQSADNIKTLINAHLTKLNKSLDSLKLISFVYGIENNINYTIARDLTCMYSGIVFRMWDGIDNLTMIEKLTSYYVFLSEFINDKSKIKPLWSEVYEDAFGFGMIVSVTYPVYIENRVPKIIGVAAIDVLLSKFEQQYGFTLDQIQTSLRDVPQCFKSTLQENQLTFLRCKQGNLTCLAGVNEEQVCNIAKSNISDNEKCGENIVLDVFYDNVVDGSDDDDKCCGLTLRQFFIILFSCISGGVFILILGFLYWRGSFHYIYNKICKAPDKVRIQSIQATSQSIASELGNLNDPKNKYKEAELSGVKIYYEEKFQF